MSSNEINIDYRALKMLKALEKASLKFMEFDRMITSREYEDFIFCFVEGKQDFKYYEPRIRNNTSKENVYIVCDSRENVINLFEMISNQEIYNKYHKGFFIDKDFSEEQFPDAIYQLPCYSIENLYCNKETFIKIVENNIGYKRHTSEHKAIIEQFSTTFNEAMDILRLFNNFAYYQKVKLNNPIMLNDRIYSFNNIVVINEDYSITMGKSITDNTIDITAPEMFDDDIDCSMVYRGKQQLEFLCKFLIVLEKNLNKSDNIISEIKDYKKHVGTLNLGNNPDAMLQAYSMFAKTPPCLITYIKNL